MLICFGMKLQIVQCGICKTPLILFMMPIDSQVLIAAFFMITALNV